MHGNYATPGLAKAIVTGPASLVLNGIPFHLVDENTPVAFYQATLTEADFNALVLTRTNGKPRLSHIPAITVDGVAWWYADSRKHWVGKLAEKLGAVYAEDGTASLDLADARASDPWASVAA